MTYSYKYKYTFKYKIHRPSPAQRAPLGWKLALTWVPQIKHDTNKYCCKYKNNFKCKLILTCGSFRLNTTLDCFGQSGKRGRSHTNMTGKMKIRFDQKFNQKYKRK